MTQGVTFLQKSYDEYTKVDKPAVVTMSYEESDKKEELETVPVVLNNNNVNVVSDSNTNPNKEDFKNDDDNFFECKSGTSHEKASYNDDAKKIVKQATQEKSAIKKLNFLINLAMVTTDTKPVPEEPNTFTKAWNHPSANS